MRTGVVEKLLSSSLRGSARDFAEFLGTVWRPPCGRHELLRGGRGAARDPASLGPRLAAALAEILAALGIPADQIPDEQQQMAQIAFAPTSSRQILGTMNDFDRMLEPAPGQSLTSAALELAQAPVNESGYI